MNIDSDNDQHSMRYNCLYLSVNTILILIVLTISSDLNAEPVELNNELSPVEKAKDLSHANIIDGLTYADNCLYMLESTRQKEQADCDKLFSWHREQYPNLPVAIELPDKQRMKFERNLALYEMTVNAIRKYLGSTLDDL